ncbi:MAG: winged helix-turn-helix domain-containing protein, partial [Microcystaceae cyanobacterium]
KYGVVFESKQSYYDLFDVARISWKKTQAHNPKHDEELVASKKKELCGLLEARRSEIESGRLVVFMVDECHLLWGDVFGYVWAAAFGGKLPPETCLGKTSERVSVPVVNARCKQTYFGGLDYKTLIVLNLPRQDCKFTRLQLVSWNTFNPNVLEQNC